MTGLLPPARISLWTIIGAIVASVIATGIIGGASGLLQVPTMARDIEVNKATTLTAELRMTQITERLRSVELSAEAASRRADELSRVVQIIEAKRDALADRSQAFEQKYVYEHAALEGRSKDRNTEAMGAVTAARAEIGALKDRLETFNTAMLALRASVFDLARAYRPTQPQSAPYLPFPPQRYQRMPLFQPHTDIQNASRKEPPPP